MGNAYFLFYLRAPILRATKLGTVRDEAPRMSDLGVKETLMSASAASLVTSKSRLALSSSPFEPIDVFAESTACDRIGTQLRLIREEAPRFRAWFAATGMPDYVETFDLVALPYPTAFGLFRAHKSRSPFVTMTNRLVVIRFRDLEGAKKTLLFEPSDVELGENAPFYKALVAKTPKFLRSLGVRKFDSVEQHLARIGIDPKEVDYLAFDHLHIQDVRRLIGTRSAAADLSPNGPIPPLFPNAKLIVHEAELSLLREMHPIQAPWYQPDTYRDLRPEGLLPITGDVLLGAGVALLSTPGHASGNQSLVLNTSTGIWAMSENVIAAELLTPELSKIPGVAASARRWGNEVILNANTIEATALQYNSVIKEKSIVDRSSKDPRFVQFFPTAELTPNWISPGTHPTFRHEKLAHGRLVRET